MRLCVNHKKQNNKLRTQEEKSNKSILLKVLPQYLWVNTFLLVLLRLRFVFNKVFIILLNIFFFREVKVQSNQQAHH